MMMRDVVDAIDRWGVEFFCEKVLIVREVQKDTFVPPQQLKLA